MQSAECKPQSAKQGAGRQAWQLRLWCLLALLIAACGGGKGAGSPQSSAPPATASGRVSPTPSGPTASVEPRTGPPGTQVTVTGNGWPAGVSVVITADEPAGPAGKPYATVTASTSGSFAASFVLEKTPSGRNLSVGRLDLVAESGSMIVRIQYQVQTPRPVLPTPSGG